MSAPSPPGSSGWRSIGILLAIVAAIAGLAFFAFTAAFFVGMANYGSNK